MSADDSQLQVLSHFVGTWDVVATADGNPTARGRYTADWILDKRFLQTTGFVNTADGSNDFEILSLSTYDAVKQIYRWWTFMSTGQMEESEGTWNAHTKTMTRITRYGDIVQTATSHFAKPGLEQWTIVNSDRNQAVVSEMSGTNTRIQD